MFLDIFVLSLVLCGVRCIYYIRYKSRSCYGAGGGFCVGGVFRFFFCIRGLVLVLLSRGF